MDLQISENRMIARYLYSKEVVLKTPQVQTGFHRGEPVYRIYSRSDKKVSCKQCLQSSPKSKQYLKLKNKRSEAERFIAEFEKDLSNSDKALINKIKLKALSSHLNGDFFNGLKQCSNTMAFNTKYIHNGIQMRSRAEVVVAECLDQLGLKYKYEPEMIIDGVRIYPDYVVYVDYLDCCIVIELFGMADSEEYLLKSTRKIYRYIECGIIPGESLLAIYETGTYMPSINKIKGMITERLNSLSHLVLDTEDLCT